MTLRASVSPRRGRYLMTCLTTRLTTWLMTSLVALGWLGLTPAEANLNHTPHYSHIKLMAIDYRPDNTAEELSFLASHFDAAIGGSPEGVGDNPHFKYTNYYCMYVGSSEYQHLLNWCAARGIDPEGFFIHYAEETEAAFGAEVHVLPAGSRVPTYAWYGGGDPSADGARPVTNPGNPHYRAWKLDYLEQEMQDEDGVFIDNTYLQRIPHLPRVISGGTIAEYPGETGGAYGDDLLLLFADFAARFGTTKAQLPNVATYADDPRLYPFAWGIFREGVNLPSGRIIYAMLERDIAASTAAGVVNLIGGGAMDSRWDMAQLATFYILANDSCYFHPYRPYIASGWAGDPRVNQWYEAVTYDVGEPLGGRTVLAIGIDPSSPEKDTLTATVAQSGSVYRLTDPTKSWTENQWTGRNVVFPSGNVMKAYRNGADWLDLYAPQEIPTDGVYAVGKYTYEVMVREYSRAIAVQRPKMANPEIGDASAVVVELPVTPDNPSGVYYMLLPDGVLDMTPRTSLSLRTTDGAVLVKESQVAGAVALYKTADKTAATPGSIVTYTIQWRNTTDAAALGAMIQDVIPAGTTYEPGSAEASGGRLDGSTVTWELGDLPPGASGTVSFQVRVDATP